MTEQSPPPAQRPAWKIVLASILDFMLVFFVGGYAIAALTGATTDEGFNLQGWPALVLFALIFAYFWFGSRNFGGTLFYRLFGVVRRR